MTFKETQKCCVHRYEIYSIETYGPISQSREKVHKRCRKCLKTISYDRYRRDVHEDR